MLTGPQNSAAAVVLGLTRTRERILAASAAAQRDARTVTLLAVSKQQSIDTIRAAYTAGQRDFGENYVQEALAKIDALKDLDIVWHFIGQLQGNKTRLVAERFHWVHTLDRARIAQRLNAQRPFHAPPLQVCVQVNLEAEPGKGGASPDEVAQLARQVRDLPRLRLRGLMCIPAARPQFEEQRAVFARLAELLAQLLADGHPVDTLSMGMSADLEAAIAAGATIVRVGTAVFGERSRGADRASSEEERR